MSQFIKHPNQEGVTINLATVCLFTKIGSNQISFYFNRGELKQTFSFTTQEERDLYYRTLEQYLILDIGL